MPVYKRNPENLAGALIVLIILLLAGRGIYDSLRYSGQLSPIADPFSEANALRAGEGYAENGFFSNAGLPDLCYGDRFPGRGAWRVEEFPLQFSMSSLKDDCIYTHYPPGPDLIAGLLTEICGVGNLGCFRLFPTTIAIFSLILFAWMLSSAIGTVKAAIMMSAIAIVPMTSNMMHGLHCQSYAFSLLLIQSGLLLSIFRKKIKLKALHLSILFIIGFLQGWLSFDYFFIVSLSALPFALLYSPLDKREDKKQLLFAVLASAIGFGFAHFLHFIQVAIYYQGSLTAAYNDIFRVGRLRFDESGGSVNFVTSRILLMLRYLFISARKEILFIINLPVLLGVVLVFLWFKDAKLTTRKIVLRWKSSGRNFYVIATAFIVSFLWVIVMKQHAAVHTPFIARHLFLIYFFCILTILECVSLDKHNPNNQEAGTWKLRP
ncbi:MAG TPA: hypothetical protein ENH01_11995 [Nitrospirae bacterium]|nr:hypothetical protein [Nitrospirota bacterium]